LAVDHWLLRVTVLCDQFVVTIVVPPERHITGVRPSQSIIALVFTWVGSPLKKSKGSTESRGQSRFWYLCWFIPPHQFSLL